MSTLCPYVMGHDTQRHRVVLSVPDVLFAYDLEAGGWGQLSLDAHGIVTTSATAEKDKDAYLVMGNARGSSVRVFDPDNAPVSWEWRSAEVTGAAYKMPSATFQCTGVHVDWHRFDTLTTGSVTAVLYVDGAPMPAMTILEASSRVYVYGARAVGHRFSLDLVGVNAQIVSARYILAPCGGRY